MAKKRKTRRVTTHRRRRVSGYASDNIEMYLLAVGGAAVGTLLIKKLFPTMKPELKAGIVGVAGFMLPKIIKGPIGQGIGVGVTAAAGLSVITSLDIMNGVMAGTGNGNLSIISGGNEAKRLGIPDKRNLSVLNGMNGNVMAAMKAGAI